MIDPLLSLAFSMVSRKGTYALLLGSGVSRAARIPTGWEITLDLIRKMAATKGEDYGEKPEEWYTRTFGEPPNYSNIIKALAKTEQERSNLLRGFFEPTEEEREEEAKRPTAAHNRIAEMVRDGYVRVILTTNFDRLIELALEEVGIIPPVISSVDQIKGMNPLVHEQCCVIKLHGDYLDSRIKNTPAELETYEEERKALLDKVLDEFGLIVCGWSAEWDGALRNAIERCPSRRFTTYWAVRGELSSSAKELIKRREAETIQIADADSFFTDLSEKVASIAESTSRHPLSASVAAATVKRYVSREDCLTRLSDLVMDETKRVIDEISRIQRDLSTDVKIEDVLTRLDSSTKTLRTIVAHGCYWAQGRQIDPFVKAIEYLASDFLRTNGNVATSFRWPFYPALSVQYTGGVASIAGRNYPALAALLARPAERFINDRKPFTLARHVHDLDDTLRDSRSIRPGSERLLKEMKDVLVEITPDGHEYEECFNTFEWVRGLVQRDMGQNTPEVGHFFVLRGREPERWGAVEGFLDKPEQLGCFQSEGLFSSDGSRYSSIKQEYVSAVDSVVEYSLRR